jgi:hypothetical protein
VLDYCKHDKHSGSIQRDEFLNYMGDYQLLKKDCVQWNWMMCLLEECMYIQTTN